jgi:hypothetical protein
MTGNVRLAGIERLTRRDMPFTILGWLLVVAWMIFHIGRSFFHSPWQVVAHAALFAPALYFFFGKA